MQFPRSYRLLYFEYQLSWANQWYIDYWVGVWWVEPTIRYRMQIVLCASAKIALNNGISNRLTNIPRFFEVTNGYDQQCHNCFNRIIH